MSLCIAFFQNNGIYVCADSRVSFDSNNTHYYVNDNCQKIKQFGDKVVFMAGDLDTVNTLFNSFSNTDTVKSIIEKVKKQFALNQSRLKKRRPEDEGDNLGAYIFIIENGVSVFYQVYHTDKWIIDRQEITKQCFKTVGAHSKEAIDFILDILSKGNNDADKIIMNTYEYFADEMVGGNMNSYAIVPGAIRNLEIQKIKDNKPLKMYDKYLKNGTYHATLDGTLTANKANIIGNIDCSSLKISGTNVLDELNRIDDSHLNIKASTINALNITAKSVSADWVYAGKINASQINTGTLTAMNIDTKDAQGRSTGIYVKAGHTPESNKMDLGFYHKNDCRLAFIGGDFVVPEGRVLQIGSTQSEYYNGSITFGCNVKFTGKVDGITTSATAVFG